MAMSFVESNRRLTATKGAKRANEFALKRVDLHWAFRYYRPSLLRFPRSRPDNALIPARGEKRLKRRASFLCSVVFTLIAAFARDSFSLSAQAPEKPLTINAIFAHGPLVGEPPDQLTWSPHGKHLTYLDGGELMDVDPATGKTHVLVSAAKMENLNAGSDSERDRDHRQR